jgi:chromosomal replication initiation ATPase DnaA
MHDFQILPIIVEVVAKSAGLRKIKRLYSNERAPSMVKLRDTVLFLIRQKTALSLEEIGRPFKKDHSTILGAIRREEARLARNPPRTDGLTWKAYHDRLLTEIATAIEKASIVELPN